VEYLLLHTSQYKADRYFGGGRFWGPEGRASLDARIRDRAGHSFRGTASAI